MILHQANGDNHGKDNGPVTVIVTRKAKKEKINEFEEWMDGIIHEAMRFEGHMGVNIIRPTDPSNPEYVVIFRFNSYENLAKWEKSEIRKEWLDKSKEVAEGEPTVEKQTGLEFWFTPHSGTGTINADKAQAAVPPPRYKMAIVITGIIFVLINTVPFKHTCRRGHNGLAHDLRDNTTSYKVTETLVVKEKTLLSPSL